MAASRRWNLADDEPESFADEPITVLARPQRWTELPAVTAEPAEGAVGPSPALPTRHRSADGQHFNQSSGQPSDAPSSHLATRLAAWT